MLKILAIIMMTVDHADRIIFDEKYQLFTIMGRFAFPLFAFLIARNGLYTRYPTRYITLLFLFGFISQPVYAYALEHPLFDPLNVLFTLGLGLLAVQAWLQGYWWALPFIIAAGWFVDYDMEGVAVMPVIAFTIHSLHNRGATHLLTVLGGVGVIILACFINTWKYVPFAIAAFALGFLSLMPSIDAVEKRLRWPGFRLFFYAYYPSHLALLAFIAWLLPIIAVR